MFSLLEILGSAWIPVVLLLGLTFYFWIRNGTWLVPSTFLGLFWSCYFAASLLAVDHRVPALGTWVLVSCVAAFQTGSALGEERNPRQTTSPPAESELQEWTRRRLRRACLLLLAIAMAGCAYFVVVSLQLFHQEFSLLSLIQMAAKWTYLRYSEYKDPWPLRLAAVWFYPPALLGGILFALSSKRADRSLGLASLLPSLSLTFLSGGRAAFLVGLVCWLGGYWSSRVSTGSGAGKLLRVKTLGFLGASTACLLLLYVTINTLRGAGEASGPEQLFLTFNGGQVRNYLFGSPAAFAEWFGRDDEGELSWGGLTFASLYDVLHLRRKALGIYSDSSQTVGSEGTNIYTLFRGLVQDFSLFGTLLICAFLGFLSARAYSRHSLRSPPLLGLAAFYSVALFSPIVCLFSFNGPIFTWGIAWLVLRRKESTP